MHFQPKINPNLDDYAEEWDEDEEFAVKLGKTKEIEEALQTITTRTTTVEVPVDGKDEDGAEDKEGEKYVEDDSSNYDGVSGTSTNRFDGRQGLLPLPVNPNNNSTTVGSAQLNQEGSDEVDCDYDDDDELAVRPRAKEAEKVKGSGRDGGGDVRTTTTAPATTTADGDAVTTKATKSRRRRNNSHTAETGRRIKLMGREKDSGKLEIKPK